MHEYSSSSLALKGSAYSLPQSQDISSLFIIQQACALATGQWASWRASFDFLPTLLNLSWLHVSPSVHTIGESQMYLLTLLQSCVCVLLWGTLMFFHRRYHQCENQVKCIWKYDALIKIILVCHSQQVWYPLYFWTNDAIYNSNRDAWYNDMILVIGDFIILDTFNNS